MKQTFVLEKSNNVCARLLYKGSLFSITVSSEYPALLPYLSFSSQSWLVIHDQLLFSNVNILLFTFICKVTFRFVDDCAIDFLVFHLLSLDLILLNVILVNIVNINSFFLIWATSQHRAIVCVFSACKSFSIVSRFWWLSLPRNLLFRASETARFTLRFFFFLLPFAPAPSLSCM